jgi:DNA polymerase IV
MSEGPPPAAPDASGATPAAASAPPPPPKRVVAHLDCDAFYASVELLRRPELRGKAVIVAGSGPRAVVTTASYEARRYGVGSAMPAARARRLCPHAIVLPPDFEAYRATSRAVWAIVGERLGALQQLGLDEAYAELTGTEKPLRVLRELVAEVLERTGISLSVGVAPNRLIAKICSDLGKPRGFVAMGREEAARRFAADPPSRLPGIGPKTAERLRAHGIATIAALQQLPESELAARFGARHGRELHRRAWFFDDSPVETERVLKSRSNERTFDEDVASLAELEAILRRLARGLCEGLAARGRRGRTIGIKVRLDDWTNVTRARTIDVATNDVELVTEIALELLRAYAPPRPVRLLGVRMASFAPEGAEAAASAPRGVRAAPGAPPGDQLALPLEAAAQ